MSRLSGSFSCCSLGHAAPTATPTALPHPVLLSLPPLLHQLSALLSLSLTAAYAPTVHSAWSALGLSPHLAAGQGALQRQGTHFLVVSKALVSSTQQAQSLLPSPRLLHCF